MDPIGILIGAAVILIIASVFVATTSLYQFGDDEQAEEQSP